MTANNEEWHKDQPREEHEKTYSLFINLTKWTGIACVGILLFLLLFVYF